jgi:hypothetical protein
MKIKLVTFSDGSYALRAAGRRLVKEADSTGWFTKPSEHWTVETLRAKMPDFYAQHESFIQRHRKGYGLWIWKPAILSYLIDRLEDGEMILLLDAGCQLNSNHNSSRRFQQYIETCAASDLLVMQLADNSLGFQNLTDAAWTKLSVLNSLDPFSDFRGSNQIQSGIIFAIRSDKSQRIASRWLNYCVTSEYSFLTDPLDAEPQLEEFREHRWEQSILSLVAKSEGVTPLVDETYFYPDWSEGLMFPIWAMRNRSGGNAFRRNFFDILKILFARAERKVVSLFKDRK